MLESDFFKRSRPDFGRLEAFGFRRKGWAFTYSEPLPGGQFRAELVISEDGGIRGRVVDLDTGEEYLPVRYENRIGAFSGKVRQMYLDLLAKIDRECFVPVSFIFDQSNRIEARISREFGVDAEFPWEKYPGNGTFKCRENSKWFAAILTVAFGKLDGGADPDGSGSGNASTSNGPDKAPAKQMEAGSDTASSDSAGPARLATAPAGVAQEGSVNGSLSSPAPIAQTSPATAPTHDAEEVVEVINLKTDPEEIPELLSRPGIFRAWHMNKKHWISAILDGALSDEELFTLIRRSYSLCSEGKSAKARSTGAWMIPSNPKVYDVDAGFRDGGGVIEWHQHNRIRPGDEVFIYCSAPYSALIYRCEVIAADLPYRGMFKTSKGYTRSMRIRLVEKYPPDRYPLSFIREHGGSVVRSARTMPADLYAAIRSDYDIKTDLRDSCP